MWQKAYYWSKKLHNLVMWGVLVLGGWMMGSGWLMHRELEGEWIPAVDMVWVRANHNAVSQYFLVVLGVQMVTGLLMWGVPEILRLKIVKPQS